MSRPRYEYSKEILEQKADLLKSLSAPFGLNVNYAVKANPFPAIVELFDNKGLGFDTSSGYEAEMLLELGVSGEKISLSSQQRPHNLKKLLDKNVHFTATSLKQIQHFVDNADGHKKLGIRINPGVGSGDWTRISTGGVAASFGIWHEHLDEVSELAYLHELKIDKIQIHIGSGTDPNVWKQVAVEATHFLDEFHSVETLNMGGGFKVAYDDSDKTTDAAAIIDEVSAVLEKYYDSTGRKIRLEIEPGKYLVAEAGRLIAYVDDIVDTGEDGYTFIKLNTGMNDILRPTLYGAYHRIEINNDADEQEDYVIVGHNCESGDILTPKKGDPEGIDTRRLNRAEVGDEVVIYNAGAYCASMSAKGYNAFPDAEEVMTE